MGDRHDHDARNAHQTTHIGLGPGLHVETYTLKLAPRDLLVLCSPGVWEHLPNLMATVTTHEVQCMAEMDPGWSVYRSFCS